MNKNLKVFEIHGFTGLLLVFFLTLIAFLGFVIFPVWVFKLGWNEIIVSYFSLPSINFFQASMLWISCLLILYLVFKNSICIKVHTAEGMFEDEELKDIIKEIEEKTSEDRAV